MPVGQTERHETWAELTRLLHETLDNELEEGDDGRNLFRSGV